MLHITMVVRRFKVYALYRLVATFNTLRLNCVRSLKLKTKNLYFLHYYYYYYYYYYCDVYVT
jgi:hypothetical protein